MDKRKIAAGALVALILGAVSWRLLGGKNGRDSGRQNRLAEVREGPIEETVEATGSVVPRNRVEVKPPIGGRIDTLLVEEGAQVKAGQIIAWMSSNDRAAILDAARAQGPAEVKRWEEAYRPTPIVAPLSGTVILRNAVPGQTVEQGSVLFALADALIVLAQVDESEIGRVSLGLPARIVLDAYPGEPIAGAVSDMLHEGKNVSNVITYGVKVKPDQAPPFIRSQMTASVSFIIGKKDKALLVPAAALREEGGKRSVMVPGQDGKPVAREVAIGIETGDQAEVLSGLSVGEKIFAGRGRYQPQEAATSPLTMGGRPPSQPTGGNGRRRQR